MIEKATVLDGVEAVRAAAGNHPFLRLYSTAAADLHGYQLDGTVLWSGTGPEGPSAGALGDPAVAIAVFGELHATGRLPGARTVDLPHVHADQVNGHLPVAGVDDWDFRWMATPPAAQPGEEAVVRLGEDDRQAVSALLDSDHPDTESRWGNPRIRRWYGIRDGAELVACGADHSTAIGLLAGLTVARDRRGRGLGAALTGAMTRVLYAEFGVVGLGVYPANVGATRLYERLGFVDLLAISSITLAG